MPPRDWKGATEPYNSDVDGLTSSMLGRNDGHHLLSWLFINPSSLMTAASCTLPPIDVFAGGGTQPLKIKNSQISNEFSIGYTTIPTEEVWTI
jgi:hypothetical protein